MRLLQPTEKFNKELSQYENIKLILTRALTYHTNRKVRLEMLAARKYAFKNSVTKMLKRITNANMEIKTTQGILEQLEVENTQKGG